MQGIWSKSLLLTSVLSKSAPSESAEGSESFLGAVEVTKGFVTKNLTIWYPQHESIVHEIEEALRKEIVAASMLSERPR